ncbi:unnamed protein product [Amoebophrya sp. A25]|nr:unnamed protein product [Amoebophrya sp. A25]|eukprot:GSA25T00005428001.1
MMGKTSVEDLIAFSIGSRVRREVGLLIDETCGWHNGIRVLGVGDELLNAGGWGRALTQKLNYQYEMSVRYSTPVGAPTERQEETSTGSGGSSSRPSTSSPRAFRNSTSRATDRSLDVARNLAPSSEIMTEVLTTLANGNANGHNPLQNYGQSQSLPQLVDSTTVAHEEKRYLSLSVVQKKVLLFLDAYDVIITDRSVEQGIVERFDSLRGRFPQCEIFFNPEFWCPLNCAGTGGAATNSHGYAVSIYEAAKAGPGKEHIFDRYAFLNSGVFIGYADTIRSVLEDPEYKRLMVENQSDDQWWWSKVWIRERMRGTNRLCLDSYGELLQTTSCAVVGKVDSVLEWQSTPTGSATGVPSSPNAVPSSTPAADSYVSGKAKRPVPSEELYYVSPPGTLLWNSDTSKVKSISSSTTDDSARGAAFAKTTSSPRGLDKPTGSGLRQLNKPLDGGVAEQVVVGLSPSASSAVPGSSSYGQDIGFSTRVTMNGTFAQRSYPIVTVAGSAVQPLEARFPKGFAGKTDGYDLLYFAHNGTVVRTDTGTQPLVLHFNAGRKGYYDMYRVMRPQNEEVMENSLYFLGMENAPSNMLLGGHHFVFLRAFLLVLWICAPIAWFVLVRRVAFICRTIWKLAPQRRTQVSAQE